MPTLLQAATHIRTDLLGKVATNVQSHKIIDVERRKLRNAVDTGFFKTSDRLHPNGWLGSSPPCSTQAAQDGAKRGTVLQMGLEIKHLRPHLLEYLLDVANPFSTG